MFARKTVLVLGSGASREAQLPTGPDLAKTISKLLTFKFDFGQVSSGDEDFVQGLMRHLKDMDVLNDHLNAAHQMTDGVRLVNSIDNYIDTHRHDPRIALVGKAAIVYSMLGAERSSWLFVDPHSNSKMDLQRLEPTWYTPFGRMLVERRPAQDADEVFSNLAIICFNYDRCVEQFLIHWLVRAYASQIEEVRPLLAKLPILRPYGKIGHDGKRDLGIAFGEEPRRLPFVDLASGIRTYTQQVEDDALVKEIRSTLEQADTIVFLGFAFHSQNMDLLGPIKRSKGKRVFATADGFSDADGKRIGRRLAELLPGTSQDRIHVETKLKCAGLFNEYRLSFAS